MSLLLTLLYVSPLFLLSPPLLFYTLRLVSLTILYLYFFYKENIKNPRTSRISQSHASPISLISTPYTSPPASFYKKPPIQSNTREILRRNSRQLPNPY
jgi:hypothetical protein